MKCQTEHKIIIEEHCTTVEEEQCDTVFNTVYNEKCATVHKEVCNGDSNLTDCQLIPQQQCQEVPCQVESKICFPAYRQECQDVLRSVPRKICQTGK